ncbi:Putative calcium-dependent channel, 7TM region phosphate [Septoria linicola]|uniref:Calcium-dependent channel, 7TM region phosphate n=1 Tax=Septoria linicola TaxID=215465 RepID=A0A9Q9B3Y2_9PEZI|nr:putative calcium-dependent channel, 7TM region phosphate [Septoria linicola]USW56952.1 Putative calcium-dependent channel, 7TM region phosphate [Septoria linicola]
MGACFSVDQSTDPNAGSSQSDPNNSSSASSLLSTLAPVFVFACVWAILFLVLRNKFPRYYRPRTFVGSLRENERTPRPEGGMFGWIKNFWAMPDTYVLNHHTLDGYLFLRFLKISVVICVVGCLITWPVLFPVNATGGGGKTQLDLLTLGNVTDNYYKMFAHAGCAIIFFSFVIYTITREMIYYISLRQAYLMSPFYSSRLSSRTVLYTSIPEEFMEESKLRRMLEPGVRKIWLATDCEDLEEIVEERDKVAMKLEGAETKLIKTASANKLKADKKGGKNSRAGSEEEAIGTGSSVAARYLTQKDRPSHKLKFLIGKKVDTIDWCRGELQRLIPEVNAAQAKHRAHQTKKLNSAFVEFDSLVAAQAAYQSLTHHQVLQMSPRFTGMTPDEVIWSNLKIKWWERVVRKVATTSFVVALIVFWSIPVAVVGAISNIDNLIKCLPWLSFINDIPPVILGVVTGLLPVILLAVLMSLLPIILRLMAKIGGAPTRSAVELTVQNSYFAFQLVQVFLVATLGSAASAVIQSVAADPASAPMVLAQNIPLASNFYLSYFVLQGLAIVSGLLVGLVGLILFMVLGKLLDKTPRKMYYRWIRLTGLGWGTLFPVYTNLLVIAICYAAIAPLVLGFAAIGLFLFYFAYRYNLLFVSNVQVETKGLVYPRALGHLFVGLYVAEVCLIGLFAISTGESVGALGPLILMILMLIFTALYHLNLNSAMAPLLNYLPKSLDAEERRLLAVERGEEEVEGEKFAAKDAHANGNGAVDGPRPDGPAPHKKPNLFQKWLRPDIYTDYETMRRLVPKEIGIHYEQNVSENAFYNPAIASPTPLLWVPRDTLGVSKQEVAETSKVIPITDEGAFLDEKNKIVWDAEDGRPPIYEEKIYY